MTFEDRRKIYRSIEKERKTRVIGYFTGDRPNLETMIAGDVVNIFVDLLEEIGICRQISLLLYTNGGQTMAAWRLINLLRSYCDDLEVIIPFKALSAGTLISLGAKRVVMTKQAALGPIDPSLNHPLNPQIPGANPLAKVAVSVEAVRGYLEAAKNELGISSSADLATVLMHLSDRIHPLVLGEIFRSQVQIRSLAKRLLDGQVNNPDNAKKIIDFLCADSGSHDYTMDRREAADLGLTIEKPSTAFYKKIQSIHKSYVSEMKVLEPYHPLSIIGSNQEATYSLVRGLVEAPDAGCYGFVTEGKLKRTVVNGPQGPQEGISDERGFEGWKRLK